MKPAAWVERHDEASDTPRIGTLARGSAAQRALLVRAALPPRPAARAVLTQCICPIALLAHRSTRASGIGGKVPARGGSHEAGDQGCPVRGGLTGMRQTSRKNIVTVTTSGPSRSPEAPNNIKPPTIDMKATTEWSLR